MTQQEAVRATLDNLKAEVVVRKGEVYTVVEVLSESNPNKTYRVDVTNHRCDCPAWEFTKARQGVRKSCKHLLALGIIDTQVPVVVSTKELEIAGMGETFL